MKTYSMDAIRNIAVMGHGKCGKTTLTEAMLFNAKMTDREWAKSLTATL